MTAAVLGKAARLQTEGRFAEALRLTAPLVAILEPSHEALASHSASLKGLGRADEALGYDRQATVRFGAGSAVAWHNLAATLGDLGRGGDAVQAAGRAMALGLDAPATWGVLARAHLATGELDKSEIAYAEVMRRAPTDIFSAAEYANLIWMRRGDFAAADAVLNTCFAAGGDPGPLLVTKARLLEASGDQITASCRAPRRSPRTRAASSRSRSSSISPPPGPRRPWRRREPRCNASPRTSRCWAGPPRRPERRAIRSTSSSTTMRR